jgi:hypothetical protein
MLKRRSRLAICLISILTATGAFAQDVSLKEKFVTELQNAVRANDAAWIAAHMRYPVRHYGKRALLIRDKSWLVKNYKSVIGAKLRTAVLAQIPDNVFENWQGLMVGEGSFNIWVRNIGDGLNERYEIVAINVSE